MLSTSVERRVLQKGPRVFALLGKATSSAITAFGPEDVRRGWAVTAEFGCLRLERLSGDEEVTGLELFLPTPFSYDYGIAGVSAAPEIIRAVFGLLPDEFEELVTTLRRGSFPMLGYSPHDLKCGITSCIIPRRWPHVVVSNMSLYGNVVSLETFLRILISSLPQGHLTSRFPVLQEVVKQVLTLMEAQRGGIPYRNELLNLAPVDELAAK